MGTKIYSLNVVGIWTTDLLRKVSAHCRCPLEEIKKRYLQWVTGNRYCSRFLNSAGVTIRAGLHQRRNRKRKERYAPVEIKKRNRKRSRKLDGIGVRRIRRVSFSSDFASASAASADSVVPIHTRSELSSDSDSAYDSASVVSVASVNQP